VKVLIDTQCWLWWFLAPDRLNARAHEIIAERRHALYLSAASSWEIAIKVGLGKLELPEPPSRYVPARLADEGIDGLPIEHAHALGVADLPRLHDDPFDRLLVSQARYERATLLTADAQILGYYVEAIWAGREPPPRGAATKGSRGRR
jgi:PIN domain nuclease of toxin-antitoxin system